jgi:hypothetical protein
MSKTPQPFFTHARPCESCGKPVDSEDLKPASWMPEILVGPCCREYLSDAMPDQPVCPSLWQFICEQAQTVRAISEAFDEHLRTCLYCQNAGRMPARSSSTPPRVHQEAA